MEITIDKKEHELKFGIKFVNKIDHAFGLKEQGLSFGMGVLPAVTALQSYDPSGLAKVIVCASTDDLPSELVEDYIECLNDTDLEKLFDNVLSNVKESTMVNFQWKKMTGKALITKKTKATKSK